MLDAELLSLGRLDRTVLLRAARRSAARHDPAFGRGSQDASCIRSPTRGAMRRGSLLLERGSEDDPTLQVLRLLEARPLSASYLQKKLPNALRTSIRSLEKKGFVAMEDLEAERDPLRASSARLRASWLASHPRTAEAHQARARAARVSGTASRARTTWSSSEASVKGASQAARSLARRKLITLEPEAPTGVFAAEGPATDAESASAAGLPADRSGAARREVSHVSAGGRHRIRENRGLSEVDRRLSSRWAAARCCWCRRSR